MWVKWTSQAKFDVWHDQIKAELGLPKPSVDQYGNIVEDAIINDSYTVPFVVSSDDVRADIEPQYAEGLTPSTNPQESHYESH